MVMLVHASECVYSDDYSFSFPSELARWSVMFIQGFVRPVAVPLFLMASAYLLVPVKTGTGAFFKKRFTRVGIPFVVFLFLYAFLPAVWGEFSWTEAWANVKQAGINFIPRESHLWFVYMMLGLYLIMPVISPWLTGAGRKELLFFLGLWAFTLCFYMFREWLGPVFGECWWNPYPLFYYVSGFVGYIVLGYYIRTRLDWSGKKVFALCIPLLLAFYAFGAWQFYRRSFVVDTPQLLELGLKGMVAKGRRSDAVKATMRAQGEDDVRHGRCDAHLCHDVHHAQGAHHARGGAAVAQHSRQASLRVHGERA